MVSICLKVTGNVVDSLKAATEFQMTKPVEVATMSAWWDERWWESSAHSGKYKLTRAVSHKNCFNPMEIPTFPYAMDQNVTRVVYDDGVCVDTWRALIGDESEGALERMTDAVVSELQRFFDDVIVLRPRFIRGRMLFRSRFSVH